MSDSFPLSQARVGARGVIVQVGDHCHHDEHAIELERRLLEFGLVEGARIEVIHEGGIKRDPIALRVDETVIALRRREAASLMVRADNAA